MSITIQAAIIFLFLVGLLAAIFLAALIEGNHD